MNIIYCIYSIYLSQTRWSIEQSPRFAARGHALLQLNNFALFVSASKSTTYLMNPEAELPLCCVVGARLRVQQSTQYSTVHVAM